MSNEVSIKVKGDATSFAEAVRQSQQAMRELRTTAQKEGKGIGSKLGEGIKENFSEIGNAGKALLGGGTLLGAVEVVHQLAEEYGRLNDMARRLDVGTDELQAVGNMGSMVGVEMESLVNDVSKLQRALEKTDDAGVQAALQELNLSAVSLAGIGPERQIEMLAKAFNAAQKEGRGLNATMELIGKGGGPLLALLRDYDEIKEQTKDMIKLGEEEIKVLDDLGDAWTRFTKNQKVAFASSILHPVDTFLGVVRNVIGSPSLEALDADKTRKEEDEKIWQRNRAAQLGQEPDTLGGEMGPATPADFGRAKKEDEEDKERMAKRAAELRIAQAAAVKLAKDMRELEPMQKALADARTAGAQASMNDVDKLAAKEQDLASLENEINDVDAFAGVDAEKAKLKLLTEREKKLQDLAQLNKKLREDAANQAKEEADKTKALNKTTAEKEMGLMSPREQAAALRNELGKSLNLKVVTADSIKGGLQSEKAGLNGLKGEKREEAEKKYQEDLDNAKKLAGLNPRTSNAPGSAASQLNILGGRSDSVVSNKMDKQTALLERVAKAIEFSNGQERRDKAGRGFGFDINHD